MIFDRKKKRAQAAAEAAARVEQAEAERRLVVTAFDTMRSELARTSSRAESVIARLRERANRSSPSSLRLVRTGTTPVPAAEKK